MLSLLFPRKAGAWPETDMCRYWACAAAEETEPGLVGVVWVMLELSMEARGLPLPKSSAKVWPTTECRRPDGGGELLVLSDMMMMTMMTGPKAACCDRREFPAAAVEGRQPDGG